ncbi:Uncharacterised protein [Burkholderia pseudomallei]|nr:Uncharacterised protein [Burkholderia pseudomallei]CPI14535.1 Uncharacterised protein [Burkholderia pseudomallei]
MHELKEKLCFLTIYLLLASPLMYAAERFLVNRFTAGRYFIYAVIGGLCALVARIVVRKIWRLS